MQYRMMFNKFMEIMNETKKRKEKNPKNLLKLKKI